MKVVLDTSILIDYLRGGNKWERVVKKIPESSELIMPTIVIYELFSGSSTRLPEHAREMMNFLKNFYRQDLTEDIARLAGELYRDVSKKLEVPDYIIAASALSIGGSVLTLNRKHFQQIPGLDLYENI